MSREDEQSDYGVGGNMGDGGGSGDPGGTQGGGSAAWSGGRGGAPMTRTDLPPGFDEQAGPTGEELIEGDDLGPARDLGATGGPAQGTVELAGMGGADDDDLDPGAPG